MMISTLCHGPSNTVYISHHSYIAKTAIRNSILFIAEIAKLRLLHPFFYFSALILRNQILSGEYILLHYVFFNHISSPILSL